MSTLPYLPAGEDELPADRFVIFADGSNRIQRFDESAQTYDGVPFDSWWTSSMLHRDSIGRLWRLLALRLLYFSPGAASLAIEFSGDGGNSWTAHAIDVGVTSGTQLRSVVIYPDTIGQDIRFRIAFSQLAIVNFVGFSPRIVPAGFVREGGFS